MYIKSLFRYETFPQVKELNNLLNSFDCGVLIDGVRYAGSNLDEVDWTRYRTLDPEEFEKQRLGICWDFVNYQHKVFDKLNVQNRSYFYIKQLSSDPSDIVTHTFTTLVYDGVWFESSWYKHHGLHEIESCMDVVEVLDAEYKSNYPCELYRYDADKTIGLSNLEFFNEATNRRIV